MEPQIYFIRESPDFNFFLERGRVERIAANRVVLCTITEFGLMNDRRMTTQEYSSFIETQQMATGTLDEKKKDIKEAYYRKKKSVIVAIEPMRPNTLVGPITGEAPIEGTV